MRAFAVSLLSIVAVWAAPPDARAADAAPPPADAPPAVAPATSAPAPAPKVFPRLRRPDLDHKLQFGFAVMPGIGYRTIFPYDENIGCGQTDKRVCSGRMPFFLDVQPSFGITQRWDVLVDLRFGIEQDFTQTHQFAVAPGFRYWVDAQLPTKFFATVQVAFDATAQHDPALHHNNMTPERIRSLTVSRIRGKH